MRHLLLATACASALSGCAALSSEPWPKAGSGGMAELLPIDDARASALSGRVEALRARGAETYAAADFAQAELLLTRVRREIAGELLIDAERDAAEADRLAASIERGLTRRGRGNTPGAGT